MNETATTLLNGSTNAGLTPVSVGVKPDVNPEVENQHKDSDLQRGAKRGSALPSTDGSELSYAERRYPFDGRKSWFVFRVSNGKALEAVAAIGDDVSFVPTLNVVEKKNGKLETAEKPLITNLLFVYATKDVADGLLDNPRHGNLSYQYDYCQKNKYGRSQPMKVGYGEMVNFINATSTDETDVRIVDESKLIRYKSDDMVEITKGKFKGVTGRVARLAGQQRVVVRLKGILNFATTYIPNSWLKKIQ